MGNFTVNAREFDHAVRFANKATGADDRPVLAHILVEVGKDNLTLVGCDGFRLHKGTVGITGDATIGQFLYHRKDMMAGIRQYKQDVRPGKHDTVELVLGENGSLTASNYEYPTANWGQDDSKTEWSKSKRRYVTVKGTGEIHRPNYPDYMQIWPRDGGSTITVDKKELTALLKDAIAMTKKENKYARTHLGLKVVGDNLLAYCIGNGQQQIGSIPAEGEPVRFTIDAQYLLDTLYGIAGRSVSIRVGNGHPVVVGETAVVMPVHVKWED